MMRNKQWHGRLRAYLELLSGDSAFIRLPLALGVEVIVEASPLLFTSLVSTMLPNELAGDQEEQDDSTLGRPEVEDDEP